LLTSIDSASKTGIETQQDAPAIIPISGMKARYPNFLFKEISVTKLDVTKIAI